MKSERNVAPFRLSDLAILSALLLVSGAFVSNATFEQVLLGDAPRSLHWGPTLFRVLLAAHGFALVLIGVRARFKRRDAGRALATQDASERSPAPTPTTWIALVGISLAALVLRLWHLDSDLWYDEVLSLLEYIRPPLGEIVTSFASQNQHMFYSLLAHASINLFGESAWAARVPSVMFGVGSIWALYLLGRRIVGDREALLACALMTVSYHHIWFSQNARGYTGLLFFATLTTWLWIESMARDQWRWWVGYGVGLALGIWVHMTMAFVVAAHGLYYLGILVRVKLSGRAAGGGGTTQLTWKPAVAWVLCGTLSLQLHALALPQFFQTALHMVSLPSDWSSPLWVISETLRSLRVGMSGLFIVLVGGAMVCAGWLSITRRDFQAGALMVLPAVIGGLTMLALNHYLWPRFFFFSAGFGLLIVVRGAMTVARAFSRWLRVLQPADPIGSAAGLALALLMIAASAATLPRYYSLPKQDFSGAREYVESNRQPTDAVVAVGLAGVAYGRYFAPGWSVAQTREEIDALRNAHSSVWLVYTLPIQVKAYRPDVWQVIENEFETARVFHGTLGGGEIFVCRERSERAVLAGASPSLAGHQSTK